MRRVVNDDSLVWVVGAAPQVQRYARHHGDRDTAAHHWGGRGERSGDYDGYQAD
jgi:hypothetical protein